MKRRTFLNLLALPLIGIKAVKAAVFPEEKQTFVPGEQITTTYPYGFEGVEIKPVTISGTTEKYVTFVERKNAAERSANPPIMTDHGTWWIMDESDKLDLELLNKFRLKSPLV